MRVGIVGAGVGGSTLAHALCRKGFDVTVFERDRAPGDTAGYRLHLSPEALVALRRGLPEKVLTALLASGAGVASFTQFSVLDHRGRTRLRLPMPTDAELLMIGRRPLRSVLAHGLTDVIRWDTTVEGYTEHPDRVTVRLTGGADTDVDVLVGADGVRSRVTQRLTGRPAARPTGVTAIAGTVPLDEPSSPAVSADLHKGLGFAIGPHGVGMFLAVHTPRPPAVHVDGAEPERPYLVWSVAARLEQFSADPAALSSAALVDEAHQLIAGWSARYERLLAATVPGSAAAFPFWFPAALAPWDSARVTVLGDAIHPMPPTAGAGASTAIIDAVNLADDLARTSVPDALRRYQRRMLAYAPRAVGEAVPALVWQRRLANPVLRYLGTSLVMPAVSAIVTLDQARQRLLRAIRH